MLRDILLRKSPDECHIHRPDACAAQNPPADGATRSNADHRGFFCPSSPKDRGKISCLPPASTPYQTRQDLKIHPFAPISLLLANRQRTAFCRPEHIAPDSRRTTDSKKRRRRPFVRTCRLSE